MIKILGAGVLAALIAIIAGRWVIQWLRDHKVGQNIRDEGPAGHRVKAGTPTMGGILIIAAATLPFLLVLFGSDARYHAKSVGILFTLLACAVIGGLDDYLKVVRRRSLGLEGRWKLIGQGLVAIVICLIAQEQGVSTQLFVPLVDVHVQLGVFWYALVFLMVVGASNAVNLTDGLDGLAAGSTAIVFLAFTAMTTIGYQAGVRLVRDNHELAPAVLKHAGRTVLDAAGIAHQQRVNVENLDMAILAACLLGACAGFLWYNAYPASVFMGDTGSLALGGAIAAFAVFTKTELLLPVIGGLFVVEALSVIIQVFWFKRTGKRVFLMAPVHHHFEMKAWSETKIMVRFWLVAAAFAGIGFVLYYMRFDQYV